MPIVVKEKSGPQVPPGTHIAVCYRIVDIGTQPDSGFGERRKIVIFWELPHERITIDGVEKAMGISKFYTNSLNKKASLRKDLDAWRGRAFTKEELDGFELKNILGKPCQISVVTNENNNNVVDAVVALAKGTQCPPAMNPLVEYSIEDGKNHVYEKLPDWVKEACNNCIEWEKPEAADVSNDPRQGAETGEADDVPFIWVSQLIPWAFVASAAASAVC